MAYLTYLCFSITLLLSQSQVVRSQITKDNFGPYDINWESFGTCKGPKQGDCGEFRIENTQNMSDVIFILNITKDCPVTKARITIGNRQNKSVKKMWNYALDSPCQHFVLGPILVKSFNLNGNCKVNRGPYQVHLDMEEQCKNFLGKSFFYGSYRFRIIAHNKNNNFFCVENQLSIEKKKS